MAWKCGLRLCRDRTDSCPHELRRITNMVERECGWSSGEYVEDQAEDVAAGDPSAWCKWYPTWALWSPPWRDPHNEQMTLGEFQRGWQEWLKSRRAVRTGRAKKCGGAE